MMGVSRAGYYKWKNRTPSNRDINREKMIELVKTIHEKHRTHGYRWTAAYIRINERIDISDNYAYKCFRFLGIKSETRHQVRYRPRKVRDKYPNLLYSTWETVDRPRQVIVSDMTAFKVWYMYIEVTFYFDVFTKEILSYKVAERRGAREQYIDGLNDVIGLLRGTSEPVILHTDQGTVYDSMAYNEQRPCFALGYDTPSNYKKRYGKGEIKCNETFKKRELTTEPKFLQKKRTTTLPDSDLENKSTFKNENEVKM